MNSRDTIEGIYNISVSRSKLIINAVKKVQTCFFEITIINSDSTQCKCICEVFAVAQRMAIHISIIYFEDESSVQNLLENIWLSRRLAIITLRLPTPRPLLTLKINSSSFPLA